jgi:hypothetical protein
MIGRFCPSGLVRGAMLPRSLRSVTRHSKDEGRKKSGHSGRDDRKGMAAMVVGFVSSG